MQTFTHSIRSHFAGWSALVLGAVAFAAAWNFLIDAWGIIGMLSQQASMMLGIVLLGVLQIGVGLLALGGGPVWSRLKSLASSAEPRERERPPHTLFRRLFDHGPDGVMLVARDGRVLDINREGLALVEADFPDQLVGRFISGVIAPGHRDAFDALLQRVFCRESGQLALELVGLNRTRRWADLRAVPLYGDSGEIAAMHAVIRDVTEQRQTLELHTRLAAVLEAANHLVALLDPEGHVEFINGAGRRLLGIEEQAPLGRISLGNLVPPRAHAVLMETGIPAATRGGQWSGEVTLYGSDGKEIPLMVAITAHRSGAGRIERLSVVGRAVSFTKSAEISLRLRDRAIESSRNGIMITDVSLPDNPIIYVNPAFERMTGFSSEEILGHNGRFLLGNDMNQEGLEELRNALRERRETQVVLRNYRKGGSLFWNEISVAPVRDDSGQVSHYVSVMSDISERKRYETQLEYHANCDPLTGVANRTLLEDRLSQAIAHAHSSKRVVAVLLLDMDRFKLVNDSLGHYAGDALLKWIAKQLTGCLRDGDTVARLGGDEFVIVLAELACEEDVLDVVRGILGALSRPALIEGQEITASASIGISLYPKDGDQGKELVKNADVAMYRAKEQGRNNFQFYTCEMNMRALEKLRLENDLRRALERNEFMLCYQPKVNLASGEITGVEALIRWNHPELGVIGPNEFVPLMEETGLVVTIGEWVLSAACAQARTWQDMGIHNMTVAVNLSARQFHQKDLCQVVARVIRESGIEGRMLELEITESFIMRNPEEAAVTLADLKQLGVLVSVDDFGTGYSSLSYLKGFPLDSVKIDGSFVSDITTNPQDAAIVRGVIALAHNLRLKVVAEGVETNSQNAFLCSSRCDEVQGFFFSRPLGAEECTALLKERRVIDDPTCGCGTPRERRTVLVVDDEENILTALRAILQPEGYHVLTAASAEEALEQLATNPVKVIITDQRLPTMSGVDLLKRVRRLHPDAKRIMLSADTDSRWMAEAVNEGAVYKILSKPWCNHQLRTDIREAFQSQYHGCMH